MDSLLARTWHNHVGDCVHTIEGDVFEALKRMRANRELFDVVIVDPRR